MTPADEAAVMQGFGNDPVQNATVIKQRLFGNLSTQQALLGALPNPTPTNTGGTTFFRDANPITNPNGMGAPGTGFTNTPGPAIVSTGAANVPTSGGVALPGAPPIPNELTPGEQASPRPIGVTPSGAPITGTTSQQLQILGIGPDGKPVANNPMGTGRLPARLLNTNKPQAGGAQTSPPQAGSPPSTVMVAGQPGIVTGLGPGQQANLTAQATASTAAFQQINDQGNAAKMQNATLGDMLADANQFTSGMTKVNDFRNFVTRQAPAIARTFGMSPDKVAANESFDKLAAQIASQQGAGSDARLNVAQTANPSSHLSSGGADQIIRQLQGNADYLQARQALAAQYPDKTDNIGFDKQANDTLDPRAFQIARMTPQQQRTFITSLSPQDNKAVHAAYLKARNMGLLYQAPAAAPATAPAAPAPASSPPPVPTVDTPRGY